MRNPRHAKEAEAWRANGRNWAATARLFGKEYRTLQRWAEAEHWEQWANTKDGELAATIQVEHEDEVTRHRREMGALISAGRVLGSEAVKELIYRYQRAASVDAGEVRSVLGAIEALVRAGGSLYDLNTITVKHVDQTNIDEVKQRLHDVGLLKPEARA